MFKSRLLAAALTLAATPTLAQTPAPDRASEVTPAPVPALAPNPARLAAAKPVIDKLWPLGTYRRIMSGTMTQYLDAIIDTSFGLKVGDVDPDAKAGDKNATIGAAAEKADPHFRERFRIMTTTMFAEMQPLLDKIEPQLRDSLTTIYARKFTPEQLADMDRFFATPSGQAYAAESMTAFMDPEIMKGMQAFVPEFLQKMPDIMKKVEAATAHLPPPPKPKSKK